MLIEEQVYTFAETAALLPRFNGRRISVSTLWRWVSKGVAGVRLEARRLGGRYVTSLEAVDRFSARLAEAGIQSRGPRNSETAPKPRTDTQRRRDVTKAEAELQKAGI